MSINKFQKLNESYIKQDMRNALTVAGLNEEQLQASNPEFSVWVSASAGTGKTKILTDRVLRLLIDGIQPEKILCLTFTKAAAGEMNNRINKELAIWATLSSQKLEEKLKTKLGSTPSRQQLIRATNLFHEKLSSIENLKIQTIHSFCQFVLSRFPIEAGISPGFKVIDEYKTEEILKLIRFNIITQSSEQPNSPLGLSLEFIASHLHENTILETIKEVIQTKNKFRLLFSKFVNSTDYEDYLKTQFNLKPYEFETDVIEEFLKNLDLLSLKFDLTLVEEDEIEVVKKFKEYINLDFANKIAKFENFCQIFLTQTGQARQKIFNKKFCKDYPLIDNGFKHIQESIVIVCEKIKSLKLVFFSKHLFTLANEILQQFENYKFTNAYLDFDDLISHTQKLLTSTEAKDWVLYKLDGFVEHILVDEAQDTNLEQWQIIEALAKEFYSGAGASEINKTLFVVGDEKQSIYSFQGADPTSFLLMNNYFKEKIKSAGKNFSTIQLSWTYRSLEAINSCVQYVFEYLQRNNPAIFSTRHMNMQCFRQEGGGKIELWPIVTNIEQENINYWPLPEKHEQHDTTPIILAKAIATYVQKLILENKYVISQKRIIKSSDILILVKQRDEFCLEVIKELRNLKVDVAGIDRMSLIDNLAIKDLICLAKFVLLPEDELNLACLLKSPFINISEENLYHLAVNRGEMNLWKYINSLYNAKSNFPEIMSSTLLTKIINSLNQFIEIYKTYSLSEIFNIILDSLGYREKLLLTCGIDVSEIINEFLDFATNFERENGNNLQEFILWIESSAIEIKRDLEHNNSLRIMTVHGSKGLQAPIVILADTTKMSYFKPRLLWNSDNCLLWAGYAANENEYYKTLEAEYKQRDSEEYLRLLYVAMTRAEDELIVFGCHDKEEVDENCWYNIIKQGMKPYFTEKSIPTYLENFFPNKDTYLTLNMYPEILPNAEVSSISNIKKYVPLIDISPQFVMKEPRINELAYSPLKSRQATEYGTIVHKILETFFTSKRIESVIKHPLILSLTHQQQNNLKLKIVDLLNHIEVRELLKYELKTEVTVGMKNNTEYSLGRLDLLAINSEEVIIIDYKTDTYVPLSAFEVPEEYKTQLKNYKNIISNIYPNKPIKTKILWFEKLEFMEIEL